MSTNTNVTVPSGRMRVCGAPVEALGEEDREIVEDELGELTRCAERAVRGTTVALDACEERVERRLASRSGLLHVDQLRPTAAPRELVLDARDRRVREASQP